MRHQASLSVVIPYFNEESSLPKLLERLNLIDEEVEKIVFVDDGSTDLSSEIVEKKLINQSPKYELVRKVNGGKASAVKAGVALIKTSHVAILDADLELDPLDLIHLWEPIKSRAAEAVLGYREFRAHSSYTFRYSYGNRFISLLYGVMFNEVVSDLMCGYKIIPVNLFRSRVVRGSKFAIELDVVVAMWLARIKPRELPVSYQARGRAEGKVIGMRDALRIIIRMVWLRVFWARQSHRN